MPCVIGVGYSYSGGLALFKMKLLTALSMLKCFEVYYQREHSKEGRLYSISEKDRDTRVGLNIVKQVWTLIL